MALIKCTECGSSVSDQAVSCPNCGCPVEEIKSEISMQRRLSTQKMIKRIIPLIIAIVVIGFVVQSIYSIRERNSLANIIQGTWIQTMDDSSNNYYGIRKFTKDVMSFELYNENGSLRSLYDDKKYCVDKNTNSEDVIYVYGLDEDESEKIEFATIDSYSQNEIHVHWSGFGSDKTTNYVTFTRKPD